MIREFICDVTNTLLRYKFWSPEDFHFSNKNVIPGCKINTNDNRPLGKVLLIHVLVDPDDRGKSFYYIADIIIIEIESKYMDRLHYAVAVIIDLLGRPAYPNEPIYRDNFLSLKKLQAEGALEEC